MANPKRAMARMVRIDAVEPIAGADRIVAAHVGGWVVVIGKGDFEAGDLAVFFETDTFLPSDDPRYARFAERGEKEMMVDGEAKKGHVLRTARLRGVYSQGLLMKPQDVLPSSIPEYAYETMREDRTNLTALCGVREYDPIRGTDQGNMRILRRYDPWVAPRTDAERIQNISEETFAIVKKTSYIVSVKVDGTSITMLNDPRYNKIRLFSHNNELATDEGFGKQVYEQARRQHLAEWLDEHPGVTLQMEACGPKINGNRLNLKGVWLFVFSAWDTEGCRYINPYELNDEAIEAALTPKLRMDLDDFAKTTDLIEHVDGIRGHVTDRLDEGVVIHVLGNLTATQEEWFALTNELGAQMQVKVISNKYLLRSK